MTHSMQLTEWALADWCRDDPFCTSCGKALCECHGEFCEVCLEPCNAVSAWIDDACPPCDRVLLTKEAEMGCDETRRRL